MLKRPLLLMLDRHALLLVFANRMASRQALCWDRREGVSPPLFLSGISADLGASSDHTRGVNVWAEAWRTFPCEQQLTTGQATDLCGS
jgi:hypothetical protein